MRKSTKSNWELQQKKETWDMISMGVEQGGRGGRKSYGLQFIIYQITQTTQRELLEKFCQRSGYHVSKSPHKGKSRESWWMWNFLQLKIKYPCHWNYTRPFNLTLRIEKAQKFCRTSVIFLFLLILVSICRPNELLYLSYIFQEVLSFKLSPPKSKTIYHNSRL